MRRLLCKRPRPDCGLLARKQADRRGFERSEAPAIRFWLGYRRSEPCPRQSPREASVIEQALLVVGETCWEDRTLPGDNRPFEARKLLDDGVERLRTLALCIGRNSVPIEQEAQIIARRDGFDLGAEPFHRIAVYARKQPPLAPFPLASSRSEGSGKCKAFDFECGERSGNPIRRKAKRPGELR